MDGAAEKDVAVGLQQPPRTKRKKKAKPEVDALAILEREIVREVEERPAEVAKALVDRAVEGQVPSLKVILEVLKKWQDGRAAEARGIERSLANEWDVEPDWRDGCCAFCGKGDGPSLESAA